MSGPARFHRYFMVGRSYRSVALDWVPSWDQPSYPRFGAWFHDRGLTLRYRGWLLVLLVRR